MIIKKSLSFAILLVFFVQTVTPARAELLLPAPGQMVALSSAFNPPVLKGIKIYPDNPLRFDFILDKGDDKFTDDQIKIDSTRLIKYFLASLTIPEKDLWVNLSPYEKDRIVPEAFGQTEMGRDLLAQDYLLKQITASVIYPEGDIGKKFWKKIYALAQEKYGTTDIPVDTFNKVWIVPEKAVVYENGKVGAAYVTESRLKVMLESDYLAQEKNAVAQTGNETNEIAKEVMRAIVIPELEREVNEGKNFAKLRQVYQSLILATWYKKKIKKSLLSAVYVDRNKVLGVNISNAKEAEKIWSRYVEAFKKGAYNLIKDEQDGGADEILPRKYFSGGMKLGLDFSMKSFDGFITLVNANVNCLLLSIYLRGETKSYGFSFDHPSLNLDRSQLTKDKNVDASINRKGLVEDIYKVYEKLALLNDDSLKVSKEDILRRVVFSSWYTPLMKLAIMSAVSGGIMSSAGLIEIPELSAILFLLGILPFSFGLASVITYFDSDASYNRLSRSVSIHRANKLNRNNLIAFVSHELAHALRLPKNSLYANAYKKLFSLKFGVEPSQEKKFIFIRELAEIRTVRDEVDGGSGYMGFQVANIISRLFSESSLADQEKILRVFLIRFLNGGVNKDDAIENVLRTINSEKEEENYIVPDPTLENEFTYGYGSGLAQLAVTYLHDVDSAINYVYLLAKESDARNIQVDDLVKKRDAIRDGLRVSTVPDLAMKNNVEQDQVKKGGIDFNPRRSNLKTQSVGGEIDSHFDPAQFQQMQNATGFSPIIINIQSFPDINRFLGLSDPPPVAAAAPLLH